MPKLPNRPAAAKPAATASGASVDAPGVASAPTSAPASSTGPSGTNGGAKEPASSSNSGGGNAGPKLPARPSAGPSLPPRGGARAAGGAAAPGPSTSTGATHSASASAPAGASAASAGGANGSSSAAGSSGGGSGGAVAAGGRRAPSGGLGALPPRGGLLPLPAQGPVLDPDEPESIAEVRRSIHAVRVQMISAALRLGYDHENALVKQVLYRLALAERLKAPWRRPGKRPDPVTAAAREAARLQQQQDGPAAVAAAAGGPKAAAAPAAVSGPAGLGFTVKIMLIGVQGSGKTQLAHALLGAGDGAATAPPAASTSASAPPQPAFPAVHPFQGATKGVSVLRGSAHGIGLVFVDTPGLSLAPGGAARNSQVLQQIRRAYHCHKPDLLVYVDRLDAAAGGGGGGSAGGGAGAELAVMQSLTAALGPGLWLNTILAFTHAGAAPPSSGGRGRPAGAPALTFENWLELRSHGLQQVIRQASGDERLMNPVAFAESHPACPLNAAGQPVIYNGMPWRQHLMLMVTSAKLLADTEALLQMQGGGAGGGAGAGAAAAAGGAGSAAALRQMMGGGRQVPMPYLMQQITQMSRPLKFPDHGNVMDVRRARYDTRRLRQERQRREAGRQVALRVLALRQAARKQRSLADAYRTGTQAGCKVTPEPPRVATRCRPSAMPAEGHRYRNPEAQGGWVVRPHMETHCADVSDGVEGFILNKVAVAAVGGAGEGDGLGGRGVPYHHYLSAQCTKDQKLLAARSEATLYHDPLGRATTSLSADLQTSSSAAAAAAGGGGGGPDVLMVLRADTRLHTNTGRGSALPKLTVGGVVARVGEEGRLLSLEGPTAVGMRLQASKKLRLGLTPTPVRLAVAAAVMQSASELAAGRLGLGRGGDACLGLNAEVKIKDLIDFTNIDVPLARSLPGDFALGLTRSPEGEVTAGFGSSVQYRLGAREMLGLRTTFGNRGRAGLSLRAKTVSGWWLGLVAMAVPLGKLLLDTASDALRRWGAQRRLRKQQRLQQQKLRQQQQQALERQQKLQQEQQQQKAKGAVPKTVGKAGVGVGKAAAAAADGKKGGSGAAARLASGKPGARPKK
ncbi:hypothetical protein CHLRE_17g707500v5 [Chlamydomonas reinhardtii]|uniref:Translocase of chloroplast 159/132 membrane anchor domain-containing protein n=1 Tax=Chlamydomonas reinhardtii TaxID=3055 RepID=A0A2K3CPC6_CHLRE|nr:uncharacterized protein CHLRE_17g707500v5 [Chlamydomonas reinhardtii]PNW70141.1 hypothetical protein CHLRE_17g707500v5 [Chlamydomonas reinhardtii]